MAPTRVELSRLGVFFVAQNLCPKLAGIVPEWPPRTQLTGQVDRSRPAVHFWTGFRDGFHNQSLDGWDMNHGKSWIYRWMEVGGTPIGNLFLCILNTMINRIAQYSRAVNMISFVTLVSLECSPKRVQSVLHTLHTLKIARGILWEIWELAMPQMDFPASDGLPFAKFCFEFPASHPDGHHLLCHAPWRFWTRVVQVVQVNVLWNAVQAIPIVQYCVVDDLTWFGMMLGGFDMFWLTFIVIPK